MTAGSEINDIGLFDAASSINWLATYVATDDALSEDALASIAAHRDGLVALIDTVENQRLPMDIREQAIFWMVQSDSDEAFDYVATLLTGP